MKLPEENWASVRDRDRDRLLPSALAPLPQRAGSRTQRGSRLLRLAPHWLPAATCAGLS